MTRAFLSIALQVWPKNLACAAAPAVAASAVMAGSATRGEEEEECQRLRSSRRMMVIAAVAAVSASARAFTGDIAAHIVEALCCRVMFSDSSNVE